MRNSLAERIEQQRRQWHWRPMSDQDTLERLKATVSAAAADPALWTAFVEELSEVLGGAAVVLTLRPPCGGSADGVVTAGIAPAFRRAYADTYYARDPWVERMAARPAAIAFGYELVPRWDLLRTEFYREWMAPQHLLPELTIAGLILRRSTQPVSTLAAFRWRTTRMLQLEDVDLLRQLLPLLREAVRGFGHGGRRHEGEGSLKSAPRSAAPGS
jgi:hypothetical protein